MESNETYKALLEAEKNELISQLETLSVKNERTGLWEADPEDMEVDADQNTVADRFEDFEERTAITKTLSERLSEIDAALGRIENNTYGICSTCGGPIEEERLQANPAANTCKAHL